jgi:formylglycine-generating enzyme required for sulfatase activity
LLLTHYEDIGGIAGSIEEATKEAFSKPKDNPPIPADSRERERLLEAAFVPALVDINAVNGEPVSRIAKESEIPADCRNLITRLVNARLLVSDEEARGADGTRRTTYRVAHEALLRRWDWLKRVLDQRAGELRTAQLIERQAAAWDRADRAKIWLDLRGDRLREAVELSRRSDFRQRLEGVPAAYVAECERLEAAGQRTARRVRVVVLTLLLGTIAGLLGVVFKEPIGEFVFEQTTLRNFVSTQVRPYVLTADSERELKIGATFRECASSCPEMVVLPSGSFQMGSLESEPGHNKSEEPLHLVTIAKPFAVAKFAVTWDEWELCVGMHGCDGGPTGDAGFEKGRKPVINVSWYQAKSYAEWLSRMTGKNYRMLSEAEWEYAARGVKSEVDKHWAYSWGDTATHELANYGADQCCKGKAEGKDQWTYTAPVGQFPPNAFGLFDMHGNVWQWVADGWHDNYYGNPPSDGSVWLEGADETRRVGRGGSWYLPPVFMRSAGRNPFAAGSRDDSLGFRVARTIAP